MRTRLRLKCGKFHPSKRHYLSRCFEDRGENLLSYFVCQKHSLWLWRPHNWSHVYTHKTIHYPIILPVDSIDILKKTFLMVVVMTLRTMYHINTLPPTAWLGSICFLFSPRIRILIFILFLIRCRIYQQFLSFQIKLSTKVTTIFPNSQDALQEIYNKEGKFPGPTIIPPRRLWTLLNFLFWATLLLSPLINFACGVVVSGSPLLIIGFILFLIVGRSNLTF